MTTDIDPREYLTRAAKHYGRAQCWTRDAMGSAFVGMLFALCALWGSFMLLGAFFGLVTMAVCTAKAGYEAWRARSTERLARKLMREGKAGAP